MMIGTLRTFEEQLFSLSPIRWGIGCFLLVLLVEVPFGELLAFQGSFPFLMRLEEWPRFGLHMFQTLCLFGVLSILYTRLEKRYNKLTLFWKKEGSAFFLLLFLYWIYWVPLGFDVTDEGGRMAHSWFMFEGYWKENLDMKVGAHALNGLWLHLLPEPCLLWGRVAYALTKTLIGFFAFRILWNAFPKKRDELFFFAFLGMLAVSIYGGQVMNYNNLPVAITLGSILAFQEGKKASTATDGWLFLGGALLPIAIFCRFPFIIFLFLAIAWLIGRWFFQRTELRRNGIRMGWMLGGMAFGFLIVSLALLYMDSLIDYLRMIDRKLIEGFFYERGESVRVHAHRKEELLSTYWSDLKRILHAFFPLLFLFLSAGILFRVLGQKGRQLLFLPLIFLLFAGAWMMLYELEWRYVLLAFPLALFIFYLGNIRKMPPNPFVAYWGLSLFFFSFLGSNNGVFNILITGGGILLFAYTFSILRTTPFSDETDMPDPRPALWASAIFIPCLVLVKKPHKIYRDASKDELTTMMGHPSLFGIFSTPSRVKKVDEVLEACDRSITPYEDGLLVVNTAPMFYWLCEAPYKFRKDWELRGMSDREKKKALNGPNAPAFILMMRKDPRDWDWPETERKCAERDRPYYDFYKEFLKGDRYEKVFDNGTFTLHQRR